MNEFIESLSELPTEDISIEYGRADIVTRKAVTALLESDTVKWLVGTLDMEKLSQDRPNETIGIGMYKCDEPILPMLLLNVLGSFSSQDPRTLEAGVSAVSTWIAQSGELVLDEVERRAREMLRK